MSHESLAKLEKLVAQDEKGEFMIPANKADLASLATIEAIRAQTDVLKGIVHGQDEFRAGMADIQKTVHSMDKRLDRIENKTLERDIQRNHDRLNGHSDRLDALEKRDAERTGAQTFARALKDYGPWVVAIIVAIYWLVTAGKL